MFIPPKRKTDLTWIERNSYNWELEEKQEIFWEDKKQDNKSKKIKIKKIYLVLNNFNEDYCDTKIVIPLTTDELIKVLEDEIIQNILKRYFDSIEIYLEYPKNIPNELKEKINNNKVGKKVKKEIEVEYWKEENKKVKEKIEIEKYEDLVQSFIDDENLMIMMFSFNKQNLIECIKNLINILKEGGDK